MQIYFDYDKKQVLQALRYHFISRQEIKILLVLVNVFAIVAAILLFLQKVSPIAFLSSSVLWLCLMVAFWIILPKAVYKKSPMFKDKFSMIFSEDKVMIENEKGYNEWKWQAFSSYIESPFFIHLYFNTKSFFLIPKASIEQFGDMISFRNLLKDHIQQH